MKRLVSLPTLVLAGALALGALVSSPEFALAASTLLLSPGAADRGADLTLVIHTPGMAWSEAVTVDLGPGVMAGQVRRMTSEILAVPVAVAAVADLGRRDVVVRDGEVLLAAEDAFNITNAHPAGNPVSPPVAVNAIVNPGFETGDMTGWIPVTWSISTILPHSGIYDAYDPGATGQGGQCIRQNFNPTLDSDLISSFTFWIRQPDDFGIAQVIVFHQISGVSVGVAFTNDDDSWTFQNHTGLVRPNDFVTGIHVCGFGGGAPTPDDSWVDDFTLEYAGTTALEPATWGAIKAAARAY